MQKMDTKKDALSRNLLIPIHKRTDIHSSHKMIKSGTNHYSFFHHTTRSFNSLSFMKTFIFPLIANQEWNYTERNEKETFQQCKTKWNQIILKIISHTKEERTKLCFVKKRFFFRLYLQEAQRKRKRRETNSHTTMEEVCVTSNDKKDIKRHLTDSWLSLFVCVCVCVCQCVYCYKVLLVFLICAFFWVFWIGSVSFLLLFHASFSIIWIYFIYLFIICSNIYLNFHIFRQKKEQMRSMGSCLKKSSTIEWSDLEHYLWDRCS